MYDFAGIKLYCVEFLELQLKSGCDIIDIDKYTCGLEQGMIVQDTTVAKVDPDVIAEY